MGRGRKGKGKVCRVEEGGGVDLYEGDPVELNRN
jgi:hypothetical protein